MIELLILLLILFWLFGFLLNLGGGLIHLLLVIALIVFVFKTVKGGE